MHAVVISGRARAEIDIGSSANPADIIGEALGVANVRMVGAAIYPPAAGESPSVVCRMDVFYDRGKDGSPSDICQITLFRDAAEQA